MKCYSCGAEVQSFFAECPVCGGSTKPQQNKEEPAMRSIGAARPTETSSGTPGRMVYVDEELSIGYWVKTLLLMSIPVAGIIIMVRWAIYEDLGYVRCAYVRAGLIVSGMGISILLLLYLILPEILRFL